MLGKKFNYSYLPLEGSVSSPFYVNKTLLVYEVASEIKKINKRVVVILDNKYPNKNIIFLIWKNYYHIFNKKFGSLCSLENKEFVNLAKWIYIKNINRLS